MVSLVGEVEKVRLTVVRTGVVLGRGWVLSGVNALADSGMRRAWSAEDGWPFRTT